MLQALSANIGLGWKWREVGSTLAYYDEASIASVKSFMVQAPDNDETATQPNLIWPNLTRPDPTQPNPTQPNPTQPNPTQPNPTQPT